MISIWEKLVTFISNLLEPYRYPPNSAIFILILTIALSVTISTINRMILDIEKLRRYEEKIRKWRQMYFKAKRTGDKKLLVKVERQSKYIQRLQSEVASERFKPMFIYLVPFMLLFWILNSVYKGITVVILPFELPRLGSQLTFFWWYLLCNFAVGGPIQKIFRIT
jgi:uncharacterized membrane protein (DUF106 family)